MTKFDKATDNGYKAIMRELRRWASGTTMANPALKTRNHWAGLGQGGAIQSQVSQGANNFTGANINAGGSANAGNFNNANP